MAIYAALGDLDAAFLWLEKAYEVRSRALVWLKVGHEFDPLRADPRVPRLIGKALAILRVRHMRNLQIV
jgi:hypothetical protein